MWMNLSWVLCSVNIMQKWRKKYGWVNFQLSLLFIHSVDSLCNFNFPNWFYENKLCYSWSETKTNAKFVIRDSLNPRNDVSYQCILKYNAQFEFSRHFGGHFGKWRTQTHSNLVKNKNWCQFRYQRPPKPPIWCVTQVYSKVFGVIWIFGSFWRPFWKMAN